MNNKLFPFFTPSVETKSPKPFIYLFAAPTEPLSMQAIMMLGSKMEPSELKELIQFDKNIREIPSDYTSVQNYSIYAGGMKSIDLFAYVKELLPNGINVDDHTQIAIVNAAYMNALDILLLNTSCKAKYMYVYFKTAWDQLLLLQSIPTGICMRLLATSRLVHIISALVLQKYIPRDTGVATVMIECLRNATIEMIGKADWLSETTRKKALAKAVNMKSSVGDDFYYDTGSLDKYYEGLTFNGSGTFVENWRILSEWFISRAMQQLIDPSINVLEQKGIADGPLAVNAFHQYQSNKIRRFYDESGMMNNWWDNETDIKYRKKADCMRRQYSRIEPYNGTYLNGNKTIEEDIADNGAIRETFLAYNKWVEMMGRAEKKLPGLTNLTAHQILFISSAQFYCAAYNESIGKNLVNTDSHTLAKYRVNIAFANFPEFGKAFNCPPRSPMNPPDNEKCRVW